MAMLGVERERVARGCIGAATPQTGPQILRPSANSLPDVKRSGAGKQARSNRRMMHTQHRANEHAAGSASLHGITNRRFIERHESLIKLVC